MLTIKQLIAGSGAVLVLAATALPTGVLAATASSNTVINGTVGSTITVTSGATVAINTTATTASAVLSSASNSVQVTTNNATGYTLGLSIVSGAPNTNLVSGSYTIAASTNTMAAPAVLADDTWGFRVDGQGGFGAGTTTAETNSTSSTTTWAGVTDTAQTIKTTTTPAAADSTTVWYAMKVSPTKPSGTYTNTVTYTATTRP